nr:MAG TPA: hypothetical protein [Caudoviricetes sp.]
MYQMHMYNLCHNRSFLFLKMFVFACKYTK